jgi:adenosine deaminase
VAHDFDPNLARYIELMPKIELHVHLEGTIRPATVRELAQRHGVTLPAEMTNGAGYVYRDFAHFIDMFVAGVRCLRTAHDVELVVYELGAQLARQNCRYAEVTFSPSTLRAFGVPEPSYLDGLARGRARVRTELGVELRWIFDIVRHLSDRSQIHPRADYTTELAIAMQSEGVVALGLGGSEADGPPEPFAPYFERARKAGLHLAPHAGETAGPPSIWGALRSLGAERLAHGIRAVDDSSLLEHLARHQICCDVCPTSNVCLGVYPTPEAYPIRAFLGAGVPFTINSDDPPYFNTTLADDYLVLAKTHGLTAAELVDTVRNGVTHCFLPDDEKARLREQVEAELARAAQNFRTKASDDI